METFLATLATMAIGSLGWIAYRHPKSYAAAFPKLLLALGALSFLNVIYWLGQRGAASILATEFNLSAELVRVALEEEYRIFQYLAVGLAGAMLYAMMLALLPSIIDLDERREG